MGTKQVCNILGKGLKGRIHREGAKSAEERYFDLRITISDLLITNY